LVYNTRSYFLYLVALSILAYPYFHFLAVLYHIFRNCPMTKSCVMKLEIGLTVHGRHLYLNVIFAALLELLCLFRLFTSLLGLGWRALSDPMHNLIVIFF